MSKYTVLTITEDQAFAAALAEGLRAAAIEVACVEPGLPAVDLAQQLLPELVLVDDRVAERHPLEAMRQLNHSPRGQRSLVMIVSPATSQHSAGNQRRGDDAGAPFDLAPLVRSILALAGSAERGSSSAGSIHAHGLEMDRRRMRATVDGRELRFTPTEFRLVWTLARKAGIVFSRQQLCDACRDSDAPVQVRTIDVHIRTIRQKLGTRAELVETVRGVGYRFLDAGQPTVPR